MYCQIMQFRFLLVKFIIVTTIFSKAIAQDCQAEGCPAEMFCENSSCECKELAELYGRYDYDLRRCRLIPGLPCISDQEDPNYVPCSLGASCINGICICDPGSRGTMDGECKSDFGQSCNNEENSRTVGPSSLPECNNEAYLHCLQGTCVCQSEEYMIWDTKKLKCVSKPEMPCGFNRIYQDNFLIECPSDYECLEDLELKFRKCKPI